MVVFTVVCNSQVSWRVTKYRRKVDRDIGRPYNRISMGRKALLQEGTSE